MRDIIRGVLISLGAFVFSAAAIVLSTIEYKSPFLKMATYVIYCLAMLFLAAEVWFIVRFFRKATLKERLSSAAHQTTITARIYDDLTFRTIVSGSLSVIVNFLFVLTKALAA